MSDAGASGKIVTFGGDSSGSDNSSNSDTSSVTTIPASTAPSTPTSTPATTPATSTDDPASNGTAQLASPLSQSEEPTTQKGLTTLPEAEQSTTVSTADPESPATLPARPESTRKEPHVPGAFPSHYTDDQIQAHINAQTKTNLTSPSRLSRATQRVSTRVNEVKGRHRSPWRCLSDVKTTYRDWKTFEYQARLVAAREGLENCAKERDRLLEAALTRQGTEGSEWTQAQESQRDEDEECWRVNSSSFDRYRGAMPRAARKFRECNDNIEIDEYSNHYPHNRAIKAFRRKGDKRLRRAFRLLSRGPLSDTGLQSVNGMITEGRDFVDQEKQNERLRGAEFKKDCLVAMAVSTAKGNAEGLVV